MNSKRIVRIVCMALAILMAVSIIVPLLYTTFAEDTSSSSTTTQDKNALREELNRLQQELNELNNTIAAQEENIDKKESTKQYYQQQANTIKAQIEVLKQDISNKETELTNKQQELEQKVLQVAVTKATFEERLKAMYMMKNESDLSTLLGVTSFSDAMRYAENLTQISESDTNLITELRTEQADLETQAAEVQAQLDELSASKDELDAKSAEYAKSIQQVNNEITQAEAEKEATEVAQAEKAEQYKQAQALWVSFAKPGDVGFVWDGGTFSWPLPGYYRLSSDYGVGRWIYGVYDVHRGMDVPAPAGTKIYAAADGVVSTTAHWSYGTCVKIDHGSGLVTIYGHMSARFVNAGDYVTKGTPIGAVGSTGNSTGNHLHFEVDINGSPTSARDYLDPTLVSQLYF